MIKHIFNRAIWIVNSAWFDIALITIGVFDFLMSFNILWTILIVIGAVALIWDLYSGPDPWLRNYQPRDKI
jgi:hypothetical protein